MKDAPELEKELILRAECTKEHLAQLFDLQESYHKRLKDCLRLAGQPADQPALQEQVETKLLVRRTALRCSLLRGEPTSGGTPLVLACMPYAVCSALLDLRSRQNTSGCRAEHAGVGVQLCCREQSGLHATRLLLAWLQGFPDHAQLEMLTMQAEAARQEAHAQKALSRTLQEQQRLADDEALQQVRPTEPVILSHQP